MNYSQRMIGRVHFPLNPIHSIGLLFMSVLLGKVARTNNLITQLAFGDCAILLVSLLGTRKKYAASVPMHARVDEPC